MTESEFLSLPDREKDALVAREVTGSQANLVMQITNVEEDIKNIVVGSVSEYPRYSTSIADAWEVVEMLGNKFQLEYDNGYFHAAFDVMNYGDCESAPLAICVAALKAKGVIE